MELDRRNTVRKVGEEKPMPTVFVWIVGGTPVSCPSLNDAGLLATRFAGEHPGKRIGVFELVGTAFVPLTYPDVTPVERESATLALNAPSGGAAQ